MLLPQALTISHLHRQYANGETTVEFVVNALLDRIRNEAAQGVFIALATTEQALAAARSLGPRFNPQRPLWGVPCVVKDNIDVAGFATTAACSRATYHPTRSAHVVQKLIAAGAIVLGKANLDQFATGLVGTRSPYGIPNNPFNDKYISGGSSSGSAVAVARGYATFALGTDTAGSGRVPAGFNNIVGLKPSRGMLSNRGIVPACAHLDCVSVFALTVQDASLVANVMAGFDEEDPMSRSAALTWSATPGFRPGSARLGIPQPEQQDFAGDAQAKQHFARACDVAAQIGAEVVPLDFSPLFEAAQALYSGAWVAQRLQAAGPVLRQDPNALDPIVRGILEAAQCHDALAAFAADRQLQALRQKAAPILRQVDALLVPTSPTIFTQAQVANDPIGTNQTLGRYTNFVNLLDLCALAVPAGFRSDGLPSGVTLIANAGRDSLLSAIGQALHEKAGAGLGLNVAASIPAPAEIVFDAPQAGWSPLVVAGAHMRGLALNWQLTQRQAVFVSQVKTAPIYRLMALPGPGPSRPGIVRVLQGGASIAAELWAMPTEALGGFLNEVPSPLGLSKVQLDDGRQLCGFVAEAYAVSESQDITALGSWRAYLAQT